MKTKGLVKFIEFLRSLAEIGIFICVFILVSLSSKDPFKSHVIGNMSNYFNNYPEAITSLVNMCICKNETFDHFCTEEENIKGCFNITSEIDDFKPLFKRKLESDSFCTDMTESFARNEGRRLSYIFDLNYQAIRKISIALLVVCLAFVFLIVVMMIFYFIFKNDRRSDENPWKSLIIFGTVLMYIAWIAKFVLSLILFHFIEDGDIGKYDSFLDCKNVKENYFEKFDDISKLRRCFLAFAILNIISECLDKAKDLFEVCGDPDESNASSLNSTQIRNMLAADKK